MIVTSPNGGGWGWWRGRGREPTPNSTLSPQDGLLVTVDSDVTQGGIKGTQLHCHHHSDYVIVYSDATQGATVGLVETSAAVWFTFLLLLLLFLGDVLLFLPLPLTTLCLQHIRDTSALSSLSSELDDAVLLLCRCLRDIFLCLLMTTSCLQHIRNIYLLISILCLQHIRDIC